MSVDNLLRALRIYFQVQNMKKLFTPTFFKFFFGFCAIITLSVAVLIATQELSIDEESYATPVYENIPLDEEDEVEFHSIGE